MKNSLSSGVAVSVKVLTAESKKNPALGGAFSGNFRIIR
jgi:hypothetical protein